MKTTTDDVEAIVRQPTAQEAAGATIAKGAKIWIPPNRRHAAIVRVSDTAVEMPRLLEITDRFPQALGNLAQTARFPHFHKPSLSL